MKKLIKKTVAGIVLLGYMFAGGTHMNVLGPITTYAKEATDDYLILATGENNVEDSLGSQKKAIEYQEVGEKIATAELTQKQVNEIKEKNTDIIVEKDKIMKGSSTYSNYKNVLEKVDLEWNKKLLNISERNTTEEVKKEIKIAIIDSGIDWGNDIDLMESISFVPGEEEMSPLFMDGSGHGNSVAGLIAAQDNGEGITGINPNASIYSIRVLDDDNTSPESRVIQGIYYAISQKVNIINMSFGMKQYSKALKKAIDDATDAGILVIAAAGNTGANVEYPAAYDNVLSVGSIDSNGELADSSAKGDNVDIVAPGELVCTTGEFGDILIESGTSLASPQVAAIASIIWQKHPKADAELIKRVLLEGTNYNTKDGYGLADERFSNKIYNKVKEERKNNAEEEYVIKRNSNVVNTVENTGCVKGSWTGDKHEELIGSGHANVKKGARYPDKEGSGFKGITDNPGWHGSYHTNYIAAYIYATSMAEALGNGKTADKATVPSGLSTAEKNNMLSDVQGLSSKWSSLEMTTDGKKRAFTWGMAAHTASDVFAHSSFVYLKDQGKWAHLAHAKNGENNYADDASEKSKYNGRIHAAQNVVKKIIALYDAGSGKGSYKQFSGMSGSEKNYRLYKLINYIKETTSDTISSPYTDYDISNYALLIFDWKG